MNYPPFDIPAKIINRYQRIAGFSTWDDPGQGIVQISGNAVLMITYNYYLGLAPGND